jgi:CubicO group peptidase (beta-lactamase class C family)
MKIDAEAAGMDQQRLARLDAHLRDRYVDPGKIAGCQVAVIRRGSLAHFSSIGYADRERRLPVSEDTIWRIYSMTKPVTGVALMTLYEQGAFQLNDPVTKFIPEWKDLKVLERDPDGGERLVEPSRPMYVKDLMMHTSGLGYSRDNADLDVDSIATSRRSSSPRFANDLETLVSELATVPLRFHPGTRWLYSLGTDICARLVEIMSGKRFDEYVDSEVLAPLGMVDTGFFVPEEHVGRFAACYRRNSRKELVLLDDPRDSGYLSPPSFLSGGGGLVSTTDDYLRFCQMLVSGGELDGRRILGRKTVELMATNHIPGGGELSDIALTSSFTEVGFTGVGFGLTMAVSNGPAATGSVGSVGEFQWGGAASTIFWVDPAEELAVVFMTQLMPSGTFDFRSQLKSIVYGAIAD